MQKEIQVAVKGLIEIHLAKSIPRLSKISKHIIKSDRYLNEI